MGAGQATGTVGQMEEKYHLQKVILGQGSFGTVWRAVDRQSGELVAIKQLDKRGLHQRGIRRQQVDKEVAILRSCAHENVTELFGTFEDATYVFLALEYCDGGDFADKVKERGMAITESETAEWVLQMCEAVFAIHNKGVCHRDIKPDNFMIKVEKSWRTNGLLKLTDFGLATEVPRGSLLWEHCGTASFMAPELHTLPVHRQGYSFPVDMWALGVSMYCVMFGGRHPFQSATGVLDTRLLCQGSMDFRENGMKGTLGSQRFSEEARNLCRQMVSLDPPRRLQAKEACSEAASWASKLGKAIDYRGPDAALRLGDSAGPTVSRDRSRSLSFEGSALMRDVSRQTGDLSSVVGDFWRMLGQAPAELSSAEAQQLLDAQYKELRARVDRCTAEEVLPSRELKQAEALCREFKQWAERAHADSAAKNRALEAAQIRLAHAQAKAKQYDELQGKFLQAEDSADMANELAKVKAQSLSLTAELTQKVEELARADSTIAALRSSVDQSSSLASERAEALRISEEKNRELLQRLERVEAAAEEPTRTEGWEARGKREVSQETRVQIATLEERCQQLQRRAAKAEADVLINKQELDSLRKVSLGRVHNGDQKSDQLQQAEALCWALKEWAERSESQLGSKAEELQQLQVQHARLQQSLAKLERTKADELEKVRAKCREFKDTSEKAERAARTADEELQQAKSRCSQLESELERSKSRVAARSKETSRESGMRELRERAELAEASAATRAEGQKQAQAPSVAASAAEWVRSEALCESLRRWAEQTELHAAAKAEEVLKEKALTLQLRQQVESLQANLSDSSKDLRGLTEQHRALQSQSPHRDSDMSARDQELERARSQCQELTERIVRAESDLTVQQGEVRSWRTRFEDLQEQVARRESDIDTTGAERRRAEAKCRQLVEQASQKETEMIMLKQDLLKGTLQNQVLQERKAELEVQVCKLNADAAAKEVELLDARARPAKVGSSTPDEQLRRARAEVQQLTADIARANTQVNLGREELDRISVQCEELQGAAAAWEAAAAKKAEELAVVEERLCAAEEELAEQSVEHHRLRARLAASEKAASSEADGVRELQEARTQCKILKEQVALRDADVRNSSDELHRLRRECQELRDQLGQRGWNPSEESADHIASVPSGSAELKEEKLDEGGQRVRQLQGLRAQELQGDLELPQQKSRPFQIVEEDLSKEIVRLKAELQQRESADKEQEKELERLRVAVASATASSGPNAASGSKGRSWVPRAFRRRRNQ